MVDVLAGFIVIAQELGVRKSTVKAIEKALANQRKENDFYC